MSRFRVIVCGCRDWDDSIAVAKALAKVKGTRQILVKHGACYPPEDEHGNRPNVSADWLAELWCRANKVESFPESADWARYGRRAGPIRNGEMARSGADLCLAFWDGVSRGTTDMIAQATAQGIPVRIVPATAQASKPGNL